MEYMGIRDLKKNRENSKRHYYKHRERYIKHQSFRRKNVRIKKKLELIKMMGGGCSRCGYNKSPYALEFHHIKDKEQDIASMLKQGLSIGNITEELSKCILLCANCHREVTYQT